jgi:uncharacterized protein (DUF302 family)
MGYAGLGASFFNGQLCPFRRGEVAMQLDYTVSTNKSFDAAVEAVERLVKDAGFRVLFVHDVSATLAEKGFQRERVSIIEMCNAKYASAVLAADVKIGLMLPCPIMVYAENGKVFISTMRPTLIGGFFPQADIAEVAQQVEDVLVGILDKAAAVE